MRTRSITEGNLRAVSSIGIRIGPSAGGKRRESRGTQNIDMLSSRALVQPVGQPAAEAGGSISASPLSPRLSPKARLATDDRELVRQMTLRFEAAAERMEAVLAALEAHGSRPQEVPAGDPPPCGATNPPAKQPSPAVSACLASWKSKQASLPHVESSPQLADAATTPATPATPEAPADAPHTAPSVTPKVSFGDAVLAARKAQRAAAGEADLDVSPQAFVRRAPRPLLGPPRRQMSRRATTSRPQLPTWRPVRMRHRLKLKARRTGATWHSASED